MKPYLQPAAGIVFLLFLCQIANAQSGLTYEKGSVPDTTIVFARPDEDFKLKKSPSILLDAWGIDIMVSNNGFGLGGFFRHQYDRE
jgi:hypothetical protein